MGNCCGVGANGLTLECQHSASTPMAQHANVSTRTQHNHAKEYKVVTRGTKRYAQSESQSCICAAGARQRAKSSPRFHDRGYENSLAELTRQAGFATWSYTFLEYLHLALRASPDGCII